jgi:hypothetical protein
MKITAEAVVYIVSFIGYANRQDGKDVFVFVG